MHRLLYLLALTLFVGASVTGVSASTDCERWFVAYRHELAHTRSLQRIAAARRRAKQKLAQYKPVTKPKLVPAVYHGPRMTPRETIHHFNLACGVLPESDADQPLVAEEEMPAGPRDRAGNDGIDLLPAPLGELISENDIPPMITTDEPVNSGGGPAPYYPTAGLGGAPPPGSPSSPNSPGGPGNPPPCGSSREAHAVCSSTPPPDNPPPTNVVPEPSSYVFLLTGVIGIAGEVRRRFKS